MQLTAIQLLFLCYLAEREASSISIPSIIYKLNNYKLFITSVLLQGRKNVNQTDKDHCHPKDTKSYHQYFGGVCKF